MDNTKNDVPDDEVEGSTDSLNDNGPSIMDVISEGLEDITHPGENATKEEDR
jgi:hypothetical protein